MTGEAELRGAGNTVVSAAHFEAVELSVLARPPPVSILLPHKCSLRVKEKTASVVEMCVFSCSAFLSNFCILFTDDDVIAVRYIDCGTMQKTMVHVRKRAIK